MFQITGLENLKPGKASTSSKEPSGRWDCMLSEEFATRCAALVSNRPRVAGKRIHFPKKIDAPQKIYLRLVAPWRHAWCMSFCKENSVGVYSIRLGSQPSRKTWTSRSLDNRGPGVDLPCSTCSLRRDSKARARAGYLLTRLCDSFTSIPK